MKRRKGWTLPELKRVKFYASEGLSIGRTAKQINRTRGSLSSAAKRYGIKFTGDPGAPFGNTHRKSNPKAVRSVEEKRELKRLRSQRYRDKKKRESVLIFSNTRGWVLQRLDLGPTALGKTSRKEG